MTDDELLWARQAAEFNAKREAEARRYLRLVRGDIALDVAAAIASTLAFIALLIWLAGQLLS